MSRGGEIKETKLQFRKMVLFFFPLIWVDWAQNICFFWTTFSSNCLRRQIPNQPITWQRFNAFRHVAVLAMLKKREKNKASMILVSAWDQLVKHQRSEVLQIFGVHFKAQHSATPLCHAAQIFRIFWERRKVTRRPAPFAQRRAEGGGGGFDRSTGAFLQRRIEVRRWPAARFRSATRLKWRRCGERWVHMHRSSRGATPR